MAKYASGKFAQRISDRSGMAFPYNEMVKEWNNSTVHISEYEETIEEEICVLKSKTKICFLTNE